MVVVSTAIGSNLKDIKEQISIMRKEIGLREKKKPTISKEQPIIPYYDCPNCGMRVLTTDYHCSCCGQAIDWTEMKQKEVNYMDVLLTILFVILLFVLLQCIFHKIKYVFDYIEDCIEASQNDSNHKEHN